MIVLDSCEHYVGTAFFSLFFIRRFQSAVFGEHPDGVNCDVRLIHRWRVMNSSESIGQYTCIVE